MKYLAYFNRFIFGATIMLYATFFLGLFAQIILGGFQVFASFFLLFFYKRIQKIYKKHLAIYWSLSITYGILWIIYSNDYESFFNNLFFYILIPLGIACYFTFILETLKETTK